MSGLKTKLPTDIWVAATWEEFIAMADDPAYCKAKCYYRNGQMRIETRSVGPIIHEIMRSHFSQLIYFVLSKVFLLTDWITVATGKLECESVNRMYHSILEKERN